jgi:hypothetical protein
MFGDILSALGGIALQTVVTSAPGLVTGLFVKHGRKLTAWIPNNAIPVLTGLAGTAAGAIAGADATTSVTLGFQTMVGAVGLHQVGKIAARGLVGRITKPDGRIGSFLRRIGPGAELSL